MDKDFLFIRHITCPCCYETIDKKTIRTSKIRPIKKLASLRMVYENFDVNQYELIWCNKCGFCTLEAFNKPLMPFQIKSIRENISKDYIPTKFENELSYTIEEVLLGYKLAIYNSIFLKHKNIERAYIIYKYTYILDSLIDSENTSKEEKIKLIKERKEVYEKVLEGLELFFGKETSTIVPDNLLLYIMAYISLFLYASDKKTGEKEYIEHLKNVFEKSISSLIYSKTITKTLKDNCLNLKEIYKKMTN